MRVIAGSRRSLPLKAPKGMDTRPTQDRTKETLFNIIQNDIYDANFLDLFAGSGGISIEALSRGARHATLVDNNQNAIACIKENLKFTHFEEQAELLTSDVFSVLKRNVFEEPFNIIFMDPPYKAGYEPEIMKILSHASYVTKDTLIIIEASLDTSLDFIENNNFQIIRAKKYKTNQHIFIKRS